MEKRVILIVLDSVGIGALPDAAAYGDVGASTLPHVLSQQPRPLRHLRALGLANIAPADIAGAAESPKAAYGKMREVSPGKDTTTGHWEIAGVQLEQAFPTFPQGFPASFVTHYERAVGRGTIGNTVASGTEIIAQLGQVHLETGKLIVYTSADSVFQVAAHEDVVPPAQLYAYCQQAREMLTGPLAVGRVIARPFEGQPGAFKRTARRRDFSLMPPENLLDVLKAGGLEVFGVGKIEDIFCGRGLTGSDHAAGNPACIEATLKAMGNMKQGLLFVNLVDTDMIYGHRNDVSGYADALQAFDDALPRIMGQMGPQDVLVITADHGCDPTFPGTDHTREYAPLLVYGQGIKPVNLGERATFADVSATILAYFGLENALKGTSFWAAVR